MNIKRNNNTEKQFIHKLASGVVVLINLVFLLDLIVLDPKVDTNITSLVLSIFTILCWIIETYYRNHHLRSYIITGLSFITVLSTMFFGFFCVRTTSDKICFREGIPCLQNLNAEGLYQFNRFFLIITPVICAIITISSIITYHSAGSSSDTSQTPVGNDAMPAPKRQTLGTPSTDTSQTSGS